MNLLRELWLLLTNPTPEPADLYAPTGLSDCPDCGCLHGNGPGPCTECSGWSCRHCGRPKTPEKVTCGDARCKRAHTRALNRKREEEAEKVVPMRGDRSA